MTRDPGAGRLATEDLSRGDRPEASLPCGQDRPAAFRPRHSAAEREASLLYARRVAWAVELAKLRAGQLLHSSTPAKRDTVMADATAPPPDNGEDGRPHWHRR